MIGGNSRGSDMLIEHSLIMAVWTQVVPKTKEAAIHRKPRRTMKAKPFAYGITSLSISGRSRKVQYLGYMVKSILEGYSSRRKVDNKDDFGN
nr:DNA-directed RNA polymerases IV and V subunit 2-like [Tanacetum cinerariifolium]